MKYIDDDEYFIPPTVVSQAATQGLEFREKFNRGGTKIGWARAKQLKDKQPVRFSEIKRIVSYFARHEVDKKAKNFGNDSNPSKGYIAWLLWGGDAGRKWATNIKNEIENKKN